MGYSVVSPNMNKSKPSSLSGQRVTKILGTAVFFGQSGNMDLGVDFTSEMGLRDFTGRGGELRSLES